MIATTLPAALLSRMVYRRLMAWTTGTVAAFIYDFGIIFAGFTGAFHDDDDERRLPGSAVFDSVCPSSKYSVIGGALDGEVGTLFSIT